MISESLEVDRPFFSPDGEWIGFFGRQSSQWRLMKIPAGGGAAVPIIDVPLELPAAWGDDGHIIYTPSLGSGLMRVSSDGGDPEPVTALEEGEAGHAFPVVLPGSKAVLYTSFTEPHVNAAQIWAVDLVTKEQRFLIDRAGIVAYAPSGYLIYVQVGRLMAVRFDAGSLAVTGKPFDVTDERMTNPEEAPTRMAVSSGGTMIYVPTELDPADLMIPMWLDLEGNEKPFDLPPGIYHPARFAPDGRTAVLTIKQNNNNDIWILDTERETAERFIDSPSNDLAPIWSGDGSTIFYSSDISGRTSVYRKKRGEEGEPEKLLESPDTPKWPLWVSRAQDKMLFEYRGGIHLLSLDGSGNSSPLVDTRFAEWNAVVSPDERWVAYSSNESGAREVYVCLLSNPRTRIQISTQGGRLPHWASNNRLRYTQDLPSRRLMEAEFSGDDEPAASDPYMLHELKPDYHLGDLHPDGKRYIAGKTLGGSTVRVGGTKIIKVENWLREIENLEPLEAP